MKTKPSSLELKKIGLSCLNVSLRRTARLVTSYYDSILKPSGLRITQFSILVGIGHEEECSITDLSRLTDIDRTTLQRSLEILKRDNLIRIEKKEAGNIRNLSLTKKGENKLAEAILLWEEAQSELTKSLGKPKFQETLRILSEVRKIPVLETQNQV
ncbi:MarR family winged helix-turn-helix transcriptional regulator [Leptospira saintgironsiae]|uniref:MarR family transcriptional regulator n=1 Tax=Leptospira saintgironsiae TaxID=2023183 RepID=A0A2M9YCH5_9LEPT|nr:MarR family winged helix-turn-helix transcriptional regulator [Leptospira saintgironsiae]PJZ49250.1 MarR family transcriptional regulator [Leptospira saintgironsiae]